MESFESLRKAAAELPHSKSLLRNIMRDSVEMKTAKQMSRKESDGWVIELLNEVERGARDDG